MAISETKPCLLKLMVQLTTRVKALQVLLLLPAQLGEARSFTGEFDNLALPFIIT